MNKRICVTVALSVLFTCASSAGELKCVSISTGVFTANGEVQHAVWVNATGATVYVKQVQFFLGVCSGGMADFPTGLKRTSDGMRIFFYGIDHYTDGPGGEYDNPTKYFNGDWITIVAGDGVTLTSSAHGYQQTLMTADELPGEFKWLQGIIPIPHAYEDNFNWTVRADAIIYYSTTQD
jgi:hypothetical protein